MRQIEDTLKQHYAAIIEGSDDAIVAKDLSSIILTWNGGAQRIFGYEADEVIGKPITILFPEDRQDEEAGFISRLRAGERIDHFETIRKDKNGNLIPVSVTISPVRNAAGEIVGASKIARDITAQHRAAEQQRLLLSEMRHRVGNCFAIASGLLPLCAEQAATVDDLVSLMRGRFRALASAHALAAPTLAVDGVQAGHRPLDALLSAILDPFTRTTPVAVAVDSIDVGSRAVTPLALVFYELCTNAVKYGALSQPTGRLSIAGERRGDRFVIRWTEECEIAPRADGGQGTGFGTTMCEAAVRDQLEGSFQRTFTPQGMHAVLDLSLDCLTRGD